MTDEVRPVRLGIIGGSGLYQIDGLKDAEWVSVASPFGEPSDQVLLGNLEGLDVAFLPRHGRGHRIPPGKINFRAHIDVLKRCGVTDIVSLSAVGSLRAGLAPGDFVVVDQFIDRTFARVKSFFGTGLVAHVSMAHSVCGRIGANLMQASATISGISAVQGGTYIVMEGPQFSTLAESELYRSWGCDVIGMTNMPEAKLDNVSVEAVIQVVNENAVHARTLVTALAAGFAPERAVCSSGCDRALDNAVMTAPDARDATLVAKLDAVAGRVLTP